MSFRIKLTQDRRSTVTNRKVWTSGKKRPPSDALGGQSKRPNYGLLSFASERQALGTADTVIEHFVRGALRPSFAGSEVHRQNARPARLQRIS